MYPQFFCFIDKEPGLKMTGIIKGLWDLGYMPFVDGVNKNNKNWFTENLKGCEYMLYWFEEDGTINDGLVGDASDPDLLVVFSQGLHVGDEEWLLMHSLMKKVHCTCKEEISDETLENIFKVFEKPPRVQTEEKKEEIVELPKSYAFRSMVCGTTAFYEIIKPNVMEPYVTMVENYEKFPFDMFTNWFKCLSFGVSGYDAAFIHQLYRNYSVGKLDLEGEFRKRVDRVVKEEDEPRIWRRRLEDVVEMYEQSGIGEKRKRLGAESMNKKV